MYEIRVPCLYIPYYIYRWILLCIFVYINDADSNKERGVKKLDILAS